MGHYDSCYEEEDKRLLENAKQEIIRSLDKIENLQEMYLIRNLIRRRDELKVFFKILKNGFNS